MRIPIVCVLFTLAAFSMAADAADTGFELQAQCLLNDRAQTEGIPPANEVEKANIVACLSYVRGFADGAVVFNNSSRKWCTPQRVTAAQLEQVYVKFGLAHPAMLDRPAGEILAYALTEAFPCRAK